MLHQLTCTLASNKIQYETIKVTKAFHLIGDFVCAYLSKSTVIDYIYIIIIIRTVFTQGGTNK